MKVIKTGHGIIGQLLDLDPGRRNISLACGLDLETETHQRSDTYPGRLKFFRGLKLYQALLVLTRIEGC